MYVVFAHQNDIRPLLDIPANQPLEQIVRRTEAGEYASQLLNASCAAQPKGCSAGFVPLLSMKSCALVDRMQNNLNLR